MLGRFQLYINTIKHMKTSQVFYRILNKNKRYLFNKRLLKVKVPKKLLINANHKYIVESLDLNVEFLNRFNAKELMSDQFEFINIKYKAKFPNVWNDKKIQQLWRYNLHYFDYTYKLAFMFSHENDIKYYEKYKEIILSWIDNNPIAIGDGWHPYTISLRITNWISTYESFKEQIKNDTSFREQFVESLYIQYSYLQRNLEKDVLGNHYFENIKALVIGSIFFKEKQIKAKLIGELLNQLEEQILDDGMHFELAPMYHKIILEDLIKITVWLKNESVYQQLCVYIQKMLNVMYSFEVGFGKTPAFNDSTDGISKNFKCLLETCKTEFNLSPKYLDSLPYSGFYITDNNRYKLIFDCGEICPSYLPAHGHCDALSYELSISGTPILVNSGTYRYEGGEWRDYFRETKAHNTVMIGDREQSQFWGSFRVANRISDVKRSRLSYEGINFIHGSYKTYFGSRHARFIGTIHENLILVLDKVHSRANEKVRSYVHIAPDTKVEFDKSVNLKNENKYLKIIPYSAKDVSLGNGWYSKAFNVKEENNHLVITMSDDSKYFGYLICLSEIDCCIKLSNDQLKISSDKEFIINLNKLGEQK